MTTIDRRAFVKGSLIAIASAAASDSLTNSALAEPATDLIGRMKWLNEPASWKRDGDRLAVRSRAKSDFWRKTIIDGKVRDSGHLFYVNVPGNCTFEARVDASYRANADHAGLMVRIDEENWLKCTTEQVGDAPWVSIGYTREVSHWSGVEGLKPGPVWLRVVRKAETVESLYSLDGKSYHPVSLVYMASEKSVAVGLVSCSPEGEGFDCVFSELKLAV
jgi:regulation of enolase protein 1 (concanavalin A-like superfamily)